MARAKMRCNGKNSDGSPCKNWALRGSFYCNLHQNQVTNKDLDTMKSAQNWTVAIIILLLVIGFLISMAGGCEKQFLKYLSH